MSFTTSLAVVVVVWVCTTEAPPPKPKEYVDGTATGISVVPTGFDANGQPTGFSPATDADAAALTVLTGTPVAVGESIYASESSVDDPSSEQAEGPERPTQSVGQIASHTGLTPKEVRDRIHEAKRELPSGTSHRNPDVAVDLTDGEMYPVAADGTYGDSIGNIYDE